MTTPHYVVGAYASLPDDRGAQGEYYALLGTQPWIDGAELPFPGDLAAPGARAWLARRLPAHWHHNTMTLIPGTMQHVGRTPGFGLASPQEEGRLAAVRFAKDARDAIAALADARGANDIAYLEIHTAPTALADVDAMRRSLAGLLGWDWLGTRLVIEHCDRHIDGQTPEKGFLPIEEEIAIAQDAGIGITVNWGRSCVEGRDAALPETHVRAAADAGVLTGLMFSGAGPAASRYGYPWIDGHLPMASDEPVSWMDAARIADCTAAADVPTLAYLGAKVCVPPDADLDTRVAHLAHIHDAGLLKEAV
ncbi:DUF4862 family protein [Bifidobacterium gallicum]|uniref:UDP-N-acetylglucosamine diphosphorylase n=1 Tax=Bifidobacterium gallicum DSM 20093 = LMG 11596 TaxID=561180 RepID=D1NX53_9BIFI|nr:DUF4862 family protein [Bifidobacterium gallicum]EFA22044.1 hypothetical protein BIFGAL_04461 [Bifidobacterium gallicum DSM 20093 = LMG 11596]KFI59009.1 UDP-N-acetylglucosamine diphosphorylase [Bifidobacterium gallicum DSM 20093 = LMG 11596]